MSQEKVDRYKLEKANRKQMMRKEKIKQVMRKAALVVVALGLLSWLGFSAYGVYESKQPRLTAEIDYTAVNAYLQELEGQGTAQ